MRLSSWLNGATIDNNDAELDLRRLHTASQAARQHPPGAPAPSALLAELRAAAQRVRGDFLEGFSLRAAPAFDNWAGGQREYWHRQAVGPHASLTRLKTEAGDTSAAVETAAPWVALDPLDDFATARLMQLNFAHGDRPAALPAYQTYRARLATEPRAESSPETQAGPNACARATYESALQKARVSLDPQLECVTLNRLATLAFADGQAETVVVRLREAAGLAVEHGLPGES